MREGGERGDVGGREREGERVGGKEAWDRVKRRIGGVRTMRGGGRGWWRGRERKRLRLFFPNSPDLCCNGEDEW